MSMGMLESFDELDADQWETVVSVHSPVVRSNERGHFFTTYSISLKSNNSCFTQPYSCVPRRYSEFVYLRGILQEHHPNTECPSLPPKKLFRRFDQSFINDRTEGLQNFIKDVLNTSVYLSNKAVHLFLQSQNSMSEIIAQVSGNLSVHVCDSCSDTSSEHTDSHISDLEDLTVDLDGDPNSTFEIGVEAKELIEDETDAISKRESFSEPIPILQPYLRSSLIKSACNSLNASPRMSPVSSSADSGLVVSRRVSFCDKVQVAVVRDQLWNYNTRPIRTCAW